MLLTIIGYDPVGAWKNTADTVEELLEHRNSSGITWINVEGLDNIAELNKLAETYNIHPLTIEDIRDLEQRPKVEEFDSYIYITLKAVNRDTRNALPDEPEGRFEQISLVLTQDTLITFQELPGDSFDPIRRRILDNAGRIRRMGADYLAYAVMDSIIDEYTLVLDDISVEIDYLEERALDENDESLTQDLQKVKQTILHIDRIVHPLRDSINNLIHLETDLIKHNLQPFLNDLHDNVMQAAEVIESHRNLLAGIMEINLATMSNRMNKVMKVLTIISTIFIPLTFIAGVYGMNFRFMPELEMPFAYFITLGAMVLIAVLMIILFKKRKWL